MPRQDHFNALSPGARLRDYRIERVLGAGGFGITYKAREDITERAVAIKEYLPSALATRERDGSTVRPISEGERKDYEWGLARFRDEARLLIGLKHPNIVPVLSYFEANGTGYLVMEFQNGRSLGDALSSDGPLTESDLLALMRPLLGGVAAVHAHGFLHRDIKPDNIYIRADGVPVLLDFGAARQALGQQSRSLTAVLTEGYAPYEQYQRDGNQGPWSDIYALGAVMFRCLLGKAPVEAPRRISARLNADADPLAAELARLRDRCAPPLAAAVTAALGVTERERPQSVADLKRLLDGPAADTAATETLVPAAVGTPRDLGAEGGGRRRRIGAIAAGLAVLGVAGAAAAYFALDFAGGPPRPGGPAAQAPTTHVADDDASRRAEEDARRRLDEERRRLEAERASAEREARRKAEAEGRERAEQDARRKAEEEARKRADEDARRKAEDEARRKAEEEGRKRAAEEARKKAEDEARRKTDEDAAARRNTEQTGRADALAAQVQAALARARGALQAARLAEARRIVVQAAATQREAERMDRLAPSVAAARRDLAALEAEWKRRVGERVAALVGEARQHIQAGRFDDAQRRLQEARQLDPGAADIAAANLELTAARQRKAAPAPATTYSRADIPAHTQTLYNGIMRWALTLVVSSSDDKGRVGQKNPYRSVLQHKAMAACIDWDKGSPAKIEYNTMAFYERAPWPSGARHGALQQCNANRWNSTCVCTIVDQNDTNVLAFPESYIAKHYR